MDDLTCRRVGDFGPKHGDNRSSNGTYGPDPKRGACLPAQPMKTTVHSVLEVETILQLFERLEGLRGGDPLPHRQTNE